MPYTETANRILDVAERSARQGGYNAFSFREIAADIGIKSASVHYHFPTKEDLGAALASRYTDRFMEGLGTPDDSPAREKIAHYVAAYAHALKSDGLMCLCGMFGAEIDKLPASVARQTREFFIKNIEWLVAVYSNAGQSPGAARQSAARLIATLEGAMILARTMNDQDLFDLALMDATNL